MTKYNLVNPLIEGNIKTSIKASNELEGAGKIYEEILAPMFITSVKEFKFSFEGGGKMYHYNVTESVNGDNAKFKIEKFNGVVNDKKFKTKLNEIMEQSGGKSKHKHKKDDDSSSSSSSDESSYRFSRYCYSPYIYSPYINTGYSYTLPYISPTYFYPYSYTYIWGF